MSRLTLTLTLTLAVALTLTLTKVAEGSGAKAELRPFDASQVLSGDTVSGRVEVKNFHSCGLGLAQPIRLGPCRCSTHAAARPCCLPQQLS